MSVVFAAAISIFSLAACAGSQSSLDGTEPFSPSGSESEAEESSIPAPVCSDDDREWVFGQVAMGGGGFVTGVFSTSEENLYYARTDVGGAYRWDDARGMWVSLSYSISEADRGLLGIDGLAVDPNAPNKIYLLAGTSYLSDGKTAILSSEDYGQTFEEVTVTDMITVHGNGTGRQNGERIAVDPNNGDIIFAGGRTGGLIKSTDGGKTWVPVSTFPVKNTDNRNGINGIVFDSTMGESGKSALRIYVSVSRKDADNIFVSEDGGGSWNAVEGMPTEYMPQRLKIDAEGNLFVTYGVSEGPSSEGKGGIYRYNASDGSVDNISPAEKRFGDIVFDPNDTDRLVACTESVWSCQSNGAYGDEFYVSLDGGKVWKLVNETMKMNNGGVSWISDYAIHWCGSMMIDPFDPNTIMVVSGNGIFRCDNIWDDAPEFAFFVKGLEETVPLDCVSIPNGNLVTAIGDYDGFENTDITEYGRLHTAAIGTTTSIAVAGLNPDVWVKAGGSASEQKLLYSEDGGDTWTWIKNPPNASRASYNGCVTVTADGKTIIWSPDGSNGTYYTTDRGETWEAADGLKGGFYVMANPADPDYVYACGSNTAGGMFSSNSFFVSSDGGKSFESTLTALGTPKRFTAAAGKAGTVYVPGGVAGLYITEDHGQNFTKLDSVKVCNALGLGKGRTEDAPYVIYIWGQPDKDAPEGIYMSEDNGATWLRINDELHQFGGTGNGNFIAGDYNVYGRCYMSTAGLGLVYCDMVDKE